MTDKASREGKLVPVSLRAPPSVHAALKRLASRNGRSLSAEVEILVERALFCDEIEERARRLIKLARSDIVSADDIRAFGPYVSQ